MGDGTAGLARPLKRRRPFHGFNLNHWLAATSLCEAAVGVNLV
jgi:hypothetical protein